MSGFALSPGLTPALTDAFLLEIVLAIGVGRLLDRDRGLETALALNAVALSVVKLVTDWGDLPDVPVGIAGAVAGLTLLLRTWGGAPSLFRSPWPARLLGGLAALLGAIKGFGDFYDPFDLTLGTVLVVVGAWLAIRGRGWAGADPATREAPRDARS